MVEHGGRAGWARKWAAFFSWSRLKPKLVHLKTARTHTQTLQQQATEPNHKKFNSHPAPSWLNLDTSRNSLEPLWRFVKATGNCSGSQFHTFVVVDLHRRQTLKQIIGRYDFQAQSDGFRQTGIGINKRHGPDSNYTTSLSKGMPCGNVKTALVNEHSNP